MSSAIINLIDNVENLSYLELGVADNKNFYSIKCKEKMSVDVNGNAIYTGTTDSYFQQLDDKRFDIIFIDANHDYDYVLRDFNNAVKHANKWILIRDMIPPHNGYTARHLCSDSYKLLYYFLKETKFEVYSTVENYGLTFIRMPATEVHPDESYRNFLFHDFKTYIDNHYKLYTEAELVDYFNKGTLF